ncbi:hypothetical protein ACFO8Q_18740 [Effusibacillus consociatus]|uniref:Sporulation membrane protein YtrI C-terminal domain-containing protein n=2 Tax=Effusibacillus consociatus TaxID=1117041 RepID=A0ABV9Q9Q8_9BACL
MEKIAIFLVGMVAGATFIVAVKGHDLDHLYLQRNQLRQENKELLEEIDSLKKDLLNRQRQSIRRVRTIEVEANAPDEFTKLAIVKNVKNRTRALLDKELSFLDSDPKLVTDLIEGRIVTVDNQSYQIRVEAVYIGETLRIWVEGIKQAVSS